MRRKKNSTIAPKIETLQKKLTARINVLQVFMIISKKVILTISFFSTLCAYAVSGGAGSKPADSAFVQANGVSPEKMAEIYEKIKTPYKYGVVVRPPKGMLVDSPSVFRHGKNWYMIYILQDGAGYSTHLAESKNLLDWHLLGEILKRKNNADWDGQQAAGYLALQNCDFYGDWTLEKFDGKYWMSYLGGALKGYETDPLSIGMSYSKNPTIAAEWTRLPLPVLSASDKDSRYFEKLTLYKSNIIRDPQKRLGAEFVMFYNCKTTGGYERISMALSDDMKTWRRFGKEPIVDAGKGLSGDPQVVRLGDVYVMFYFNAFCKNFPKTAVETFACSTDLIHWTDWNGVPLVVPSEKFDNVYAHKPWVVTDNGVVYHFYCAVGSEGRVIALATSKNLSKNTKLNQ